MASLLAPRAATLLKGSVPTRSSLSNAGTRRQISQSKSTARPLIATFRTPLTASQITAQLLTNTLSVRHYSGRDARRAQRTQAPTQVRDYEEPTYERGVTPTQNVSPSQYQEPQQQQQIPPQYSGFSPNATSEELITPGVLAHLRKVYSLLGVAAGAAAIGGVGAATIGIGSGVAMAFGIGAIVPMIATIFTDRAKVMLRQNMFLAAALMMGVGIGPILGAVSLPTILLALGGSGAIMAGFSLAALKAPSGSYLKFGGLMMGLAIALLGAALLALLGPAIGIPASILAGLKSFSLYGGLAIFALFVAYDTQQMIDRAAAGETDHVSDALNLFIDVWGIFVRLLYIFNDND